MRSPTACATGFAFFASLFVLRQGLSQLLGLVLNCSVIQEGLSLLQLSSSCAGYHILDTGNTEIILIHLTTALQGRSISQTRKPRLGEVKDMMA